jgi:hypothetical protein
MKIRLLKNYKGRGKGQLIEVSERIIDFLVSAGFGEVVEEIKQTKVEPEIITKEEIQAENKAIVPKYKKRK